MLQEEVYEEGRFGEPFALQSLRGNHFKFVKVREKASRS